MNVRMGPDKVGQAPSPSPCSAVSWEAVQPTSGGFSVRADEGDEAFVDLVPMAEMHLSASKDHCIHGSSDRFPNLDARQDALVL